MRRGAFVVLIGLVQAAAGCGGRVDSSGAESSGAGAGGPGSGVSAGGGAAPATPVAVASNAGRVTAFAVDSKRLYWIDSDQSAILTCEKGACASTTTTLASGQSIPVDIAVDATNVYWTNAGSPSGGQGVMTCPIAGCSSALTPLDTSSMHPGAIALDGNDLYWVEDEGALRMVPISGGGPKSIWQGAGRPSAVAVQRPNAYVATDDGVVWRCPLDGSGGAPTVLATGQGYVEQHGIAADDSSVYWAGRDSGNILKCASQGCAGSPEILASGQRSPIGITVSALSIYWTNQATSGTHPGAMDGQIMQCSVQGCSNQPTERASRQASPWEIVIDTGSLYWANSGNVGPDAQIMRLDL